MSDTPASERVSTWGAIICANIWMTCGTQPIGYIFGMLMLLPPALAVWNDRTAAQKEAQP